MKNRKNNKKIFNNKKVINLDKLELIMKINNK